MITPLTTEWIDPMQRRRLFTNLMAIGFSAPILNACAKTPEKNSSPTSVSELKYKIDDFSIGIENPWGMAFLPDGHLLVTAKAGQLWRISPTGKAKTEITGVPEVDSGGQGGLLDVQIDPDFSSNQTIYFTYAKPDGRGGSGTAVARARLGSTKLEDVTVLWAQSETLDSPHHFGSRIAFKKDKTLFVSTGDRGSQRGLVQDLSTTIGKVIRINRDGSVPLDNPFVNEKSARSEIWSYGHRNVQGAFVHPLTDELWSVEHGPQGGDEINLTLAGRNYGWPLITYGKEYSGLPIGPSKRKGMEEPNYQWTPSVAPCGMNLYTGDAFPELKNHLMVAVLKYKRLSLLGLDGTKLVFQGNFLEELEERIRHVVQGPNGHIYVATDSEEGRIIRISPRKE
jgi:aldose sugar dehydrogenase